MTCPEFHRNPELDRLMALQRDGNPEVRRHTDRAISATTRISLGFYEQQISDHVDRGLPLPEGVLEP